MNFSTFTRLTCKDIFRTIRTLILSVFLTAISEARGPKSLKRLPKLYVWPLEFNGAVVNYISRQFLDKSVNFFTYLKASQCSRSCTEKYFQSFLSCSAFSWISITLILTKFVG